MPANDKVYKLQVDVGGLDKLAAQVQKEFNKIKLDPAALEGAKSKAVEEFASSAVNSSIQRQILSSLMPQKALTTSEKMLGGLGALGMYDSKKAGKTSEAFGGGKVGGAMGMAAGFGVFDKMLQALQSLGPIQAILMVIGTIFKLAMLPLALVLMAILMPFLLPVLQLFSKLPWQQFMQVMMAVSAGISTVLGFIWDSVVVGFEGWSALINGIAQGIVLLLQGITYFEEGVMDGVVLIGQLYTDGMQDLVGVIQAIGGAISNILSDMSQVVSLLWNWFAGTLGPVATDIWNAVTSVYDWFEAVLGPVANAIGSGVEAVVSVLNSISSALGSANPSNWHMPSLAVGGIIQQSGVAMVHAGETIVPARAAANKSGASPTINVTVTGNNISKDIDMQNLAQKVAQEISNARRRQVTW